MSLRPRPGRVSMFYMGQLTFSFQAGHIAYQGPVTDCTGTRRPVLDRGKVMGFRTEKGLPQGLELSGFAPGLGFEEARAGLAQADGLAVSWPELGTITLGGFQAQRIDLEPRPGGVLFWVSGKARGPVRREGWTKGGPSGVSYTRSN